MEGHAAGGKVKVRGVDIGAVGLQIGIQRQRQVQIRLEVNAHRLTDAAQHRVEVVAVPEEGYALPVSGNALFLGEKVAAGGDVRFVGGLGNAEGDVAGGGVVGGNGDLVHAVCRKEGGHVKAEGANAGLVIPAKLAVHVQVAGLAHALKGNESPLVPVLRRDLQYIAVEGDAAGLAAACILNGDGENLPVVEGVGQFDLLPALV